MNLELQNQLTLAVEEYKNSAQFSEERRGACADAFRFGEEETRARISRAHPEWDLSFLDAEHFDACTPGAEEAEYEDISDVDLDAILGPSEAVASEECPQSTAEVPEALPSAFEVGETSQVLPVVTEEALGIDLNPDP